MTDRDYTTKRETCEVGTLRELNVQPGDVVEYRGKRFEIASLEDGALIAKSPDASGGQLVGSSKDPIWRIISRAALPQGHARLPSGAVVDLTAIREPFGLLDAETQEALRKSGGPWEFFEYDGLWRDTRKPIWTKGSVYRVKPQPPAPVVETVTHYWNTEYGLLGDDDPKTTHRITFDLIDGVPDPASIRMVAL